MENRVAKILISSEGDQSLDQMLNKIKDGFTGGRITKSDLASWIITHFESESLDSNIEKIRKDHFDQVAYLESVLKEVKHARKNGASTPDLAALLSPVTESRKGSTRRRKEILAIATAVVGTWYVMGGQKTVNLNHHFRLRACFINKILKADLKC